MIRGLRRQLGQLFLLSERALSMIPSIAIDDQTLKHWFGVAVFSRGRDYYRRGQVLGWQLQPAVNGNWELLATVNGSDVTPYEVAVSVTPGRRGAWVLADSECSCPVGYRCKHAAAVMLAVREGNATNAVSAGSDIAVVASDRNARQEQQALQRWLATLEHQQQLVQEMQSKPAAESEELRFVLMPGQGAVLMLTLMKCRRKKDGELGKGTRVSMPTSFESYLRPRWLSDADVPLLMNLRVQLGFHGDLLRGSAGAKVLELLVNTGRCHWLSTDSAALTLAPAITVTPEWVDDELGRQRLQLITAERQAACEVLPLAPPYLLDKQRAQVAELNSGFPPLLAQAICDMPALSGLRLLEMVERLRRSNAALPMPTQLPVLRDDIAPIAIIRCNAVAVKKSVNNYMAPDGQLRYVELLFDYAGSRVDALLQAATLSVPIDGQNMLVRRHGEQEAELLRHLPPLTRLQQRLPLAQERLVPATALTPPSPDLWLQFVDHFLPLAQAAGWQCENLTALGIEIADVTEFALTIDESPRQDWFDINLDFQLGDERINLLPLLQQYGDQLLRIKEAGLITLADPERPQHFYRMETDQLKTILQTLVELFDNQLTTNGALRLPDAAALRLTELPVRDWRGGERLQAWRQRLQQGLVPQEVSLPASFQASLRPYQQQGLNWLQSLRECGLHGLLADDMGLGKTVQTLAHISVEKHNERLRQPVLIISPTSLVANWRHEAARFTPDMKVVVYHGAQRENQLTAIKAADIVLTSYPILARDSEILANFDWHLLVLDEAQTIKNVRSKVAQEVRKLNASYRLALTGTPMENHLGELWSLMDFLMPSLLGDEKQFRRVFRKPIEDEGNDERRQMLVRRIAPLMLRRKKQDVVKELPAKVDVLRTLTLEDRQRSLYEAVRVAMQEKVKIEIAKKGLSRSQIVILDALLKLRQVCCDPRLVKLPAAKAVKQSAKMNYLLELLPELLEEGRRILLFSQFTEMLDLIEAEVVAKQIAYVRLDGQTKDRELPVRRFQDGEVPLFLISLKAGGVGLNLTAADTVIHYDPWWNPAAEQQATDRAHRIGQEKTVFVYKLISEGTVEEKILALQARKQSLADGVYGDQASEQVRFSGEDLELLLQALP